MKADGTEGVSSVPDRGNHMHDFRVQRMENMAEWYHILGLGKTASRNRKPSATVL